jgi:ABC-type glutathione transport system ATPase component
MDVDRKKLPIWGSHDEIVAAVRRNRTVIVVGETGSGKTTQLPQFLLDAGINKRKGQKQRRGKVRKSLHPAYMWLRSTPAPPVVLQCLFLCT